MKTMEVACDTQISSDTPPTRPDNTVDHVLIALLIIGVDRGASAPAIRGDDLAVNTISRRGYFAPSNIFTKLCVKS